MVSKKASAEKKKERVSAEGKSQESVVKSSKDEIDAIFSNKKRKAVSASVDGAEEQRTDNISASQKKKSKKGMSPVHKAKTPGKLSKGKVEKLLVTSTTPRKKTVDGLAVYTEDELKWNSKHAGGTPLCPFDCDCCF